MSHSLMRYEIFFFLYRMCFGWSMIGFRYPQSHILLHAGLSHDCPFLIVLNFLLPDLLDSETLIMCMEFDQGIVYYNTCIRCIRKFFENPRQYPLLNFSEGGFMTQELCE